MVVYLVPPVYAMEVTIPPVKLAVADNATPPPILDPTTICGVKRVPPVIVTAGAVTYPDPGFVILILVIFHPITGVPTKLAPVLLVILIA